MTDDTSLPPRRRSAEEDSFMLWAVALAVVHVLFTVRLAIGVMEWQLDEHAHASFALWIAETGQWLPDLNVVRKLADDWSGWSSDLTLVNHPLPYYWAMAAVAGLVDGYTAQIIAMRLANVVLSTLTVIVIIATARRLPLTPWSRVLFVALVVLIPWLGFIGGHVSNDNQAFLGGALLGLGAWRLLGEPPRLSSWLVAGLGLLLAGAAKGNGLFLAGLFGLMVMARVLWRQPSQWRSAGPWLYAAAGLLAAVPYAYFAVVYGSPVPATQGIRDGMRYWLEVSGWESVRLGFWDFFAYFWQKLLSTWNPFVTERTHALYPPEWYLRLLLGTVPLLAFAVAVAQMLRASIAVVRRNGAEPLSWMLMMGGVALGLGLAANLIVTYKLHAGTGWLNGIWPRYYMPLMVLPALAVATMMDGIVPPAWHRVAVLGCVALLALVWAAR